MKITVNSLDMTLNVLLMIIMMIMKAKARSVAGMMESGGENQRMTRREINPESSANISTISEVTQLQTELANLSIPSYLKELYINLTYHNGAAHASPNHEEIRVNTIQSYANQAKNATYGYYKFDVHKDKTDGEQIVRAELRLLQKNSTTLDGHYNVDIYYLLNESSHQSPLRFSFKHIDSTPGWKTFDITPIVLSWKQGLVNHGLQLRLTRGEQILSCEGVFSQGEQDPVNTEPLLIVYTNDHGSKFFKHMLKEERRSLNKNHARTQPQGRNQRAVKVQNVGCHRKEMILTADSLSAGDVHVLLPKSFDAGVCEGHCKKLQLSPHTDHAHLLSLYYRNNVDLTEVPSKCCVPTSYKPINMVFYNATSNKHIIKQNVLAQVNECNCL